MSEQNWFGLHKPIAPKLGEGGVEHVLTERPLQRILAFTRRSIDDVINDPIARNEVIGYYKLYRSIERDSEIVELENQWNPLGRKR